jgi:branched-chain amino acid transport system substrate-binding protein
MFGPDNHYRDATVIRALSIHRGLLRIALIVLCCSLAILQLTPAQSADVSNDVVKIGVLTDMTGPFADFAGNGSLTAITMAVQDFGGKVAGKPIEVVSADHQNKADVGLEIARRWFDVDHVDAIFDISNSGVALSVVNLAKDKNKIVVLGGVSSTRFTGDACTANSIQYVYDANALSNVVAKQLLKEGADTWFFITVDFAFGHGLEKATANVVTAGGGKVLGSVRHPLNTVDFAPYLLTAQASEAKVIALANGGNDTVNAIKEASEFGLTRSGSQRVASLLTFISDVHSMGLSQAQGLWLTEGFYWDTNDETRAFSKRFFEKIHRMPTMVQAGMYSAVMHYLKSVEAEASDDTAKVMAKMKATPVNDFFAKNGHIRPDGLHVHDMYSMQVKAPAESKYPWDYYIVRAVVPGTKAFSPSAPKNCPLTE